MALDTLEARVVYASPGLGHQHERHKVAIPSRRELGLASRRNLPPDIASSAGTISDDFRNIRPCLSLAGRIPPMPAPLGTALMTTGPAFGLDACCRSSVAGYDGHS